ncbi:hypothetical protein [Sphingomonas elodea]|uniref:hypothetical protein n=1 Tax=Sphingomonas elodea TaxID=179878 RepID=UPI001ED92827|nr:hypothetical protein [Sphingomonas elodea]
MRVGEGLLACTLPRADWTHEAHLAACCYLLSERPDVDVDADIGGIIRRFNDSTEGVSDDHHVYQDTVTCASVAGVHLHLADCRGA